MPSLPLQVETDQATLSQDVASGRSARFLWTAFGFAVLGLIGVTTCALPLLSSHASANPQRLVPTVAFNPSLPALRAGGLRPAIHSGNVPARPTAIRPVSARMGIYTVDGKTFTTLEAGRFEEISPMETWNTPAEDDSQSTHAEAPKSLGTLIYFPVLAKGLAPALCAELSGLPWKGNRDVDFTTDQSPRARAPFGQLPILETEGLVIGQSIAICNYIGKVTGSEGKDVAEYAMSQMLLAEGEDLYALMRKYQDTAFVKSTEDNAKFWGELVPAEMKKLEALLSSTPGDGFTVSETTTGELYLFAMLHQMKLISGDFLKDTPGLQKFYESTNGLAGVQKVLRGESAMGQLNQYFIPVD